MPIWLIATCDGKTSPSDDFRKWPYCTSAFFRGVYGHRTNARKSGHHNGGPAENLLLKRVLPLSTRLEQAPVLPFQTLGPFARLRFWIWSTTVGGGSWLPRGMRSNQKSPEPYQLFEIQPDRESLFVTNGRTAKVPRWDARQ